MSTTAQDQARRAVPGHASQLAASQLAASQLASHAHTRPLARRSRLPLTSPAGPRPAVQLTGPDHPSLPGATRAGIPRECLEQR
jgi:hypothetical protein